MFFFNNLRGDFYGDLTVAVGALPLALAFGVGSGAGSTPCAKPRPPSPRTAIPPNT